MKFLVTGASGFVGANLVREIASRGMDVIAATVGPPAPAALDFLKEYESLVKWVPVDVREKGQVEDAVRKTRVDTILHCAAITSVSGDVSVLGALQWLKIEDGIERFMDWVPTRCTDDS